MHRGLLSQLTSDFVFFFSGKKVQVHLDYLEAGADVIISASYQVRRPWRVLFQHRALLSLLRTRAGLTLDLDRITMHVTTTGDRSLLAHARRPRSRGSSRGASRGTKARSCCVVACTSRRVFVEGDDSRSRRERPPVLVAASIGSYGAY